MGILGELLHTVATNLGIPQSIDEGVFITHSCGKVNHLDLVIVVRGGVLPEYPAPSVTAGFVIGRSLIHRFYDIIGDGCFNNGLEGTSHGNGAPGGMTFGHRDDGMATALTFHLAGIGEGDSITLASFIVAQVCTNILSVGASLADQYPAVVTNVEQTGEGVTLAKGRRLSNRSVGGILLFVRGFGLCKSHHGLALRTDEAGGLFGEVEASGLLFDDGIATELALALRQCIAESHVVIGYEEGNRHGQAFFVLEVHVQLISYEVRRRSLGTCHGVILVHQTLLAVFQL